MLPSLSLKKSPSDVLNAVLSSNSLFIRLVLFSTSFISFLVCSVVLNLSFLGGPEGVVVFLVEETPMPEGLLTLFGGPVGEVGLLFTSGAADTFATSFFLVEETPIPEGLLGDVVFLGVVFLVEETPMPEGLLGDVVFLVEETPIPEGLRDPDGAAPPFLERPCAPDGAAPPLLERP
jgi:hypothetical protein